MARAGSRADGTPRAASCRAARCRAAPRSWRPPAGAETPAGRGVGHSRRARCRGAGPRGPERDALARDALRDGRLARAQRPYRMQPADRRAPRSAREIFGEALDRRATVAGVTYDTPN